VQALAYDALTAAARHLRCRGVEGSSHEVGALEERAYRIRASMLEQFWVDDDGIGFFAAALDFSATGARRPLRTRVSDMGHLLVSGLFRSASGDVRERRDAVIRQLFSPGLLCSAGIRSLHAAEVRYWPGGYHTGSSWLWQSMHIADGLEQHGFALLAAELRDRCWRVHMRTGLLPEFARGDDRGVLNDRIVDLWQAADRRENRLEQPPQEVQAWTVAGLYAAKRRIGARARALPGPTTLEQNILADLPEDHAFGRGATPAF
jgi:glycogen debranching enzyme